MRHARRPVLVALIAAVAATAGSAALGQANVCTRLEAQLVSLDRAAGSGDPTAFREYDQSVRQQQREVDQATDAARRDRCIGTFIFARRNDSPRCQELRATIDRMKANLDRLAIARDRYTTNPNARARQRRDILNALSANRCRSAEARLRPAPRGGGLLDTLFGTARMRSNDSRYLQGPGGTYRTLCVRACDGYYFPISFSTVASQFAGDEQQCRARCPAADVSLYVHRSPGEDADAMVSLAGQPYTALPTAFSFRQSYNPSCGCGSVAALPQQNAPANTFASLAPGFDAGAILPSQPPHLFPRTPEPFVPLPPRRPTRYEDPETLANRAGGLLFRRPVAADATRVANLTTSDGVRIVGPVVDLPPPTGNSALIPRTGRTFLRSSDVEGAGASGG